jgi:hypothetical protein
MPYKDPKKRNMSAIARRAALAQSAHGELPEGFVPHKITTGKDGAVVSVQSRPQGDERPTFDIQLQGQHVKGISTLLDGEGHVSAQWIKTDTAAARRYELALESLRDHMAAYQGVGAQLLNQHPVQDLLEGRDKQVDILLGDPHFGMLSWHVETGNDFDLAIADEYMAAAVDLLIERTPVAEMCRVVNLGDFFHANDQTSATPRGGNRLDTDSRFAKVTRLGYSMLRRIVDRARQKFPLVEVISLQGNHDPTISLALQMWLEAVYEGDSTVRIVPNENPYIVREFGECLTMYHHGDGAKPEQCPGILASWGRGRPWGRCEHREIQGGHVHHLTRKEFPGVVFETSRTTAPGDFWHHWKGYRAGRGMRSVVRHASFGRLSEHSVGAREIELLIRTRKTAA